MIRSQAESMQQKQMQTATDDLPVHIYEPRKPWQLLEGWREFWHYRELLFFLTWRDIMIRYKQAVLGIGWAILQPVLTVVIFSVIFGMLAKLPSEGIPYPIFSFAALLPWQLFAGAMSRAGNSLVLNRNLITKVYFPRVMIPLSSVLAGLVDFLLAFLVLLVMMLIYGVAITWTVLLLPLLVIFALLTAFAVGVWLSALNVRYRDVQHLIPFLIQAWMYASPVAYSIELIPEGPWRILYSLNPLVGVIQGFRWAIFGGTSPDLMILVSGLVVALMMTGGLLYFRQTEEGFADVI